MKLFTPLMPIIENKGRSIFLAGSISQQTSDDWQTETCTFFADTSVHIYNPARADWDESWDEKIGNVQFEEQVKWELDAMEQATLIVMNFLPASKSPITLLELGLYANSGKLMVCCPDAFYKSGNVQLVCERYRVPIFKIMQDLLQNITITNDEH